MSRTTETILKAAESMIKEYELTIKKPWGIMQ